MPRSIETYQKTNFEGGSWGNSGRVQEKNVFKQPGGWPCHRAMISELGTRNSRKPYSLVDSISVKQFFPHYIPIKYIHQSTSPCYPEDVIMHRALVAAKAFWICSGKTCGQVLKPKFPPKKKVENGDFTNTNCCVSGENVDFTDKKLDSTVENVGFYQQTW